MLFPRLLAQTAPQRARKNGKNAAATDRPATQLLLLATDRPATQLLLLATDRPATRAQKRRRHTNGWGRGALDPITPSTALSFEGRKAEVARPNFAHTCGRHGGREPLAF